MRLVLARVPPSLTALPRQPQEDNNNSRWTLGRKDTQDNNNNSSSSSSSSNNLRGSSNNNNRHSHKGSTLDLDPLLALGRAILVTG